MAEIPPCIYRVHRHLRDVNKQAYEPEIISLGPYHHGKDNLKTMENYKSRYLQSLLDRNGQKLETYISAIRNLEKQARDCYAGPISLNPDMFTKMLVRDGCFVIELLRKSCCYGPRESNDNIFIMRWMMNSIQRDLLLFENQIPLVVLLELFDLIVGPGEHESLIDLVIKFWGNIYPGEEFQRKYSSPTLVKSYHILDLLHQYYRPSSADYHVSEQLAEDAIMRRESLIIHSATELKNANVKFQIWKFQKEEYQKKEDAATLFDVDFKEGTLRMPPLTIEDRTECFLRNFIAYEHYFPNGQPNYVADYARLLNCLIDSPGDLEILSQAGIINNLLGDNEAVAKFVNRLTSTVSGPEGHFVYAKTFESINLHCKKPWKRVYRHSIYRVHKHLRDVNEKAYEPEIISIGPYHHGKDNLKMMENYKSCYLQSLLDRTGQNHEMYISAIKDLEKEARDCYAEPISLGSDMFTEMLVLDGCFIIELLLLQYFYQFVPREFNDIFRMGWMMNSIQRDLLLSENQIPLVVLFRLFDVIVGPGQHERLIHFVIKFWGNIYTGQDFQRNYSIPTLMTSYHILDLLHKYYCHRGDVCVQVGEDANMRREQVDEDAIMRRELLIIPSATELTKGNVKFQKMEDAAPFFDLRFKAGTVLTRHLTVLMPPLTIEDRTECFLRNFIAYEHYLPNGQPSCFTDYARLLKCLIDSAGDVEVLSQAGIINNLLGEHKVVAKFVNRLTESFSCPERQFVHADAFKSINSHYKMRSWVHEAYYAASAMLTLTVIQTMLSMIQLFAGFPGSKK